MPTISIEVRKQIIENYFKEKNITLRDIAKQYNVSKDSVQKIIKKFREHNTLENMPGRGRKKGCMDPKLDGKIVSEFRKKRSISTRDLAKKLRTSVGNVQNAKKRNSLLTRKKQKIPKRSAAQLERAKSRAVLLNRFFSKNTGKCILLDDETYVKKDMRTLPGPQFYTFHAGEDVPDQEKTVGIEKFGVKILVWQAICSCGLKSSSFFTTGTVNGDVYRKECIKKRLVPLYRKHGSLPIFWPDLATAHYAGDTLSLLNKEKIEFVSKEMNPPNCPELRPIEKYWAIIKRDLLKKGAVAQDMEDFKKMWNAASRRVTKTSIQALMARVPKKVRDFAKSN